MKQQHKKVRGKSSKAGGGGNRKMLVGAGLLGLAALYFIFGSDSQSPTVNSSPSSSQPQTAAAKAPQYEVVPEVAPPPASKESTLQMQILAIKNIKHGVKRLKLEEVNGVFKIPFTFVAKKQWCMAGDLDTFQDLIKDPDAEEVLITMETLTSTQRGDRYRTSIRKLMKGFQRTFSIPVKSETESLGLYMCRDAAKTNTCRGKQVLKHHVLTNRLTDLATANEAGKLDYVLYFQNFLIRKGSLIAYTNENILAASVRKLRTHLIENFKVREADFKAALDTHAILRSLPAEIKDSSIALILPYNDPRCMTGERE